MTNSDLTSRLRNYVAYTDYSLKTLLLENELDKYSSLNRYSLGKSYFVDDADQNYLIFQSMHRYLKFVTNSQNISSWRPKGWSDKKIKVVNGLYLSVNHVNEKLRLKFEDSCLAKTKVTYTHKNIVNNYIVYEIDATIKKLINCLFSAVNFAKNSDINKFGYTGYGIRFDRGTTFSFPSGEFGHNVLIFGVTGPTHISGSTHIDNK